MSSSAEADFSLIVPYLKEAILRYSIILAPLFLITFVFFNTDVDVQPVGKFGSLVISLGAVVALFVKYHREKSKLKRYLSLPATKAVVKFSHSLLGAKHLTTKVQIQTGGSTQEYYLSSSNLKRIESIEAMIFWEQDIPRLILSRERKIYATIG